MSASSGVSSGTEPSCRRPKLRTAKSSTAPPPGERATAVIWTLTMTPAGIVTPPAPTIGVVSVDTNRSPTALNLVQTDTCGLSTITVPAETWPAATPGTVPAVSRAGGTGADVLTAGAGDGVAVE